MAQKIPLDRKYKVVSQLANFYLCVDGCSLIGPYTQSNSMVL